MQMVLSFDHILILSGRLELSKEHETRREGTVWHEFIGIYEGRRWNNETRFYCFREIAYNSIIIIKQKESEIRTC